VVIEIIGRILHSLLIGGLLILASSLVADTPTLEELYSTAFDCYTPLMRFVHCLCFGRTIKQVEEEAEGGDASSWLKLRVQIFVISELIKSIRSAHVGLVQRTIGLLLQAHSVNKALYNKLNELGLCHSYRTGLREKMSKFVDSVRQGLGEGMAFTRWEHVLVIFDNIGSKRGGTATRVGYLQMTLLIMVRATRDLLVAWKIIPNPAADICGDILDRKRKKWSGISE
jgi:hypothetical protein